MNAESTDISGNELNLAAIPLRERTVKCLHGSLVESLPSIGKDAPVLDLGCGTGAWLQRLREAGFTNLTGLDVDLTNFGALGVRTLVGDIDNDDVGLLDRRFSLITAIEVIEHLSNPGRLLHHAAKHLARDGTLLITSPNIHSLVARLRFLLTGQVGQFDDKGDRTHVVPVLFPGFERLLTRYGLSIQRRWGFPATGSIVYRRELRVAARVLGPVLPKGIPGDILCMEIRRSEPSGRHL